MPEYQWKLTIIERNLSVANWMKLIPEAQERMLEEADELMPDLSVSDQRRLLTSLEQLAYHTAAELGEKIQQILSNQLSLV